MTSDSDSCSCIWSEKDHAYEPTGELGTRDCLAGGTDIDSGHTYIAFMMNGLTNGTFDRSLPDKALYNTYMMRMRLGLFDPKRDHKYRHIDLSVVGSEESNAKSLLAARKAMVLLRNEQSTLPFKAGSSIAVIGQAVNNTESFLTGNYDGPLCAKKPCFPTILSEVVRLNAAAGGKTTGTTEVQDDEQRAAAASMAKASDAVVLVVDNARDGGGEGHDRYTVGLSEPQIALCEAVLAAGKPTVLVMVNGGAISIDGLKDKAPAIIEAFMPGVHGGTAIAETIFGENNPGGKLPVTIYPSSIINETDFISMDMTNGVGRSYKFYTGTPLWPFGFG